MADTRGAQLVRYLNSLKGFSYSPPGYPYDHMGATITDGILQAHARWITTVMPRVHKIRSIHQAATTSGFQQVIRAGDIKKLLDWDGDEKPRRIMDITDFLATEHVETEANLKNWLYIGGNATRLLAIRGIGPKTLDYFKMLSGIQSVAVDTHIFQILSDAGISITGYSDAQNVLFQASEQVGVDKCILDHSIWKYMSERKRGC